MINLSVFCCSRIDFHQNIHSRVLIVATVALIIVATVYEKRLIGKGFDLNGEKKNVTDRHEMNHFNNNNNNDNECEMYNKIHQESVPQKLGEKQILRC